MIRSSLRAIKVHTGEVNEVEPWSATAGIVPGKLFEVEEG